METTLNSQTVDRAADSAAVVAAVQQQWFARPADQKFSSLDAILAHTRSRAMRSVEFTATPEKEIRAVGFRDSGSLLLTFRGDQLGGQDPLTPSNWSFGQFASLVGAPAKYLKELPAPLAAECINVGIEKRGRDQMKLMTIDPESDSASPTFAPVTTLQAVTGPDYGRIFDCDVVEATQRWLGDHPEFESPHDWGKDKRALFASDRDVFMFFIDGGSIVDGGGERDQLHRGFYVWNSEVGSKKIGVAWFLFRQCCGNFGIWGAEDVHMRSMRHSKFAPDKWEDELGPAIEAFCESSTKELEEQVRRAKAFALPAKEEDLVEMFLKTSTRAKAPALFTKGEIARARQFAQAEEGGDRNLWAIHNGFTASARLIPFRDARLDLETRAGALMEMVAA